MIWKPSNDFSAPGSERFTNPRLIQSNLQLESGIKGGTDSYGLERPWVKPCWNKPKEARDKIILFLTRIL